ncbi:hypothetical protein UFOVP119_71 [uncultured Caudovirales phage]|uniref:Uncharacterized protein n=1 Tax=uncultured Caudovirales phage TaxID=2100421 RepID=A0A6J5LBH2_9CAUD|nr:hypothetical protein UFOVP119_71 [uncultured Caudovirales phage]
MAAFLKAVLAKALPSWTIWTGIGWAVLSQLPDVLNTVVGWVGPASPALAAKVVAATMIVARLKSIVGPVLSDLGVDTGTPPAK